MHHPPFFVKIFVLVGAPSGIGCELACQHAMSMKDIAEFLG
jgi:hypothetical protein